VLSQEILSAVMVKNLDTGELVPLAEADQKLPKCVDPLVLHIMERTNDYPRYRHSCSVASMFYLSMTFVAYSQEGSPPSLHNHTRVNVR